MNMITINKRIISMLLLLVTVITSININELAVQASPGITSTSNSEYVTLVRTGAEVLGPSFKGDEAGATVHRFTYPTVAVKDMAGTVGYCIEPFARGVSPSGQAQTFSTVPSAQLDDLDKQLLGIMMAGYPIVTHGKSAADEYMATQIAIQHFVFQHPEKYPNGKKVKFNNADWSRWSNDAIVDLAKVIYAQGVANPYVPGSGTNAELKATPENNGNFVGNGNNINVKILLESSGAFQKGKLTLPDEIRNLVKSGKGTITVDGVAAAFKPYILGSDDAFEGIEIKPGNTEVIISLDKLSAEAYVPAPGAIKSVEFTFQTTGGDALQAFKGVNLNNSNQDYIFIAPGQTAPVSAALSWTREFIPTEETDPGDGGLRILKYNKKTNQLVSGAIFEIRGASETNWDFLVHIQASPGAAIPLPDGGMATTGVGTITLTGIRPGQYQITEITPPPNFDYCDLGVNSQVATVLDSGDTGLFPQVRFENNPYGSMRIRKIDAVTGEPVNGAILRIRNPIANIDVEMVTMNGGIIDISNLPQGNYEISEVFAPNSHIKSDEVKTATIRWGETTNITFENQPKTELLVKKIDADTGETLSGAIFRLTRPDTGDTWEEASYYDGYAVFQDIPAATLILEEIKSPTGYVLDTAKHTIVVENHKANEITIQNSKKPGLVIKKYDESTGLPLSLTAFRVAKMSGQIIYEGMTDDNGEIRLDGIEPGWYKIAEIAAAPGYLIATEPKDVLIEPGQQLEVKFDNNRRPTLILTKLNGLTNLPVAGATYKIEWEAPNGGLVPLGSYITNAEGKIIIPQTNTGWFVATEVKPAPGFSLPSNPVTRIYLAPGANAYLSEGIGADSGTSADGNTAEPNNGISVMSGNDFAPTTNAQGEIVYNYPLNSIVIKKTNIVTGELLAGATFGLYRADEQVSGVPGTLIGRYTTDHSGVIVITGLQPGFYVVKEEQAPPFFLLSENNQQNGFLKADGTSVLEFSFANIPYGSILITKTDGVTNQPLAGVVFKITDAKGAVVGNSNGEYTTDSDGKILIPNVKPADYVITELRSLPNYTLDSTPKVLSVGTDGKTYSVSFVNYENGSLIIKKTDSVTKAPIEGVAFSVSRVNGEKIGSYKTDKNGLIAVPNLAEATYSVVEEKSKEGYLLDSEPKLVEIKKGATITLEVENTPVSGLLIVKRDEMTGKPLQGVVYDVRRADGQFVAGNILDGNQPNTVANSPNKTTSPNGDITGSYTTDANGRILINMLPAGEYHVVERKALDNYEIDPEVHAITITPGKLVTLQLTNRQKAGLRLVKIDSVTKLPIYNVEFMLFDANNKVVGTYYTDNNGVIDFTGKIPEGRYTIRETRESAGYYPDHTPRTVEFVSSRVTEIVWENTPHMGQIQLFKKSGDDNQVNGLPAGSPLAGAIFEVYNYKSGELVDRFTSSADGRAVSNPLPLGRYLVKEVQSPQWYKLSTQTLDIELEFATQIIKQEFLNYSANTGVYIKKTGPAECMPGNTIRYDIKSVQNTSTVPLTDFYWRDTLPVNAVRLEKIVTGTYNQALQYKAIATTNKGDTKIIADNLSTTRNNVIDCSNASLGLKNDEYVTSVTFMFGTVKAGFAQVECPQIYAKALTTLQNGYVFANKVDVGGKYGREWVVSNSTCITKVYRKPEKLPRTGY